MNRAPRPCGENEARTGEAVMRAGNGEDRDTPNLPPGIPVDGRTDMPAKFSHLMTVSQEHAMQTGTFDVSVGSDRKVRAGDRLGPGRVRRHGPASDRRARQRGRPPVASGLMSVA